MIIEYKAHDLEEAFAIPERNVSNETKQSTDGVSDLLVKLQEKIEMATHEDLAYENIVEKMRQRRIARYDEIERSINELDSEINLFRGLLQTSRNLHNEDIRKHIETDLECRKLNEYLAYRNYQLSSDLRKSMQQKKVESITFSSFSNGESNSNTIDMLLAGIENKHSIDTVKNKNAPGPKVSRVRPGTYWR